MLEPVCDALVALEEIDEEDEEELEELVEECEGELAVVLVVAWVDIVTP